MSNGTDSESRLPWRIEAFREYLTFETLQPAAAVFSIFEGEEFDIRNPRIIEMQNLLELRTGKSAWIPNRSGSKDIEWNVEGDVTRNKGRVLTSMLILYPKEWKDGKVALTQFGKALAEGRVNKGQFYDFIITRFKYPHPAWTDNWDKWTEANKQIYPFILILQALVELFKKSPTDAFLTTEEIADYLHPDPNHATVSHSVGQILSARKHNTPPQTARSDNIHRKISDLLGFLCLTPYCYFDGNKVFLNLLDKHQTEKSSFWGKRKGQDKLSTISKLISATLN